MGPVVAWPARLLPQVPCQGAQPRQPAATHAPTALLTEEQLYAVAVPLLADSAESFVHDHGRTQITGSTQGTQRNAPHPWCPMLCERTCIQDTDGGTTPPGPQQGEELVMQAAGYQAILHGQAKGYRLHLLAEGKWTIWRGTTRQGAFPPRVDSRQAPTEAYYIAVDPWPLAVLLHTMSTPSKGHEPGWTNPPTLVWNTDQEEHLQAAWHGAVIRTTDVVDLHAEPITHARPAATLAVGQRGRQSPKWVVCMFSPADAHIAICDPQRLPGPETTIRVADCARVIVKALREGDHHALLLQACLKDHAKAVKPGVWPEAALSADLELQLVVLTPVYHFLQSFIDLRWSGKPDRKRGARHWQGWLQADTQHAAIRGLGPAPTARALDASAPGRALAPHMLPLANLPFNLAPESSVLKSVSHPQARGATELLKCLFLCRQVLHKRGNDGTPGMARGARRRPGSRQGSGIPHPPRKGTDVPVASPLHPAPPPLQPRASPPV